MKESEKFNKTAIIYNGGNGNKKHRADQDGNLRIWLLNPDESYLSATSMQAAYEAAIAKTEDTLFNRLSDLLHGEEMNEMWEEKEETDLPDITDENDVIEIDWQNEIWSVWECPRANAIKDRASQNELNAGEDEFQCYNNN